MRVLESPADPAHDERPEVDRHLQAELEMARHELLQVHALHVLHGDVEGLLYHAELVDLDDVLVDEVGDELGLADKHLDEVAVPREALADGLDRDLLLESLGAVEDRLVDRAHAAVRNLPDELEMIVVGELGRFDEASVLGCGDYPRGASNLQY